MPDLITNDGIPVPILPPVGTPDHRFYTPETDTYMDCPALSKSRVIAVPRGIQGVIEWELRKRNGDAYDISNVVANGDPAPPGSGQVIWRFRDALCDCSSQIHQIIGYGSDVENGKVRVELSEALAGRAGIYQFEIAVTDSSGVPQLTDKGLLSIERGLFVSIDDIHGFSGPLTINEVRLYLRDSVVENDLHDEFEFDEAEIVHAIMRPLMEWNETPPDLGCYNANNFPFRHFWLVATTAELLKIAAHWYRRNKLKASHGGITVDDKNKDGEYLMVAKELSMEWKEFIARKKLEINIGLASGSVGSPYAY